MRNFFSRAFVFGGLVLLASCGGGDGSSFDTPPAQQPGGGGNTPNGVQLGSPAGAGFQQGAIAVGTPSLSAGGTSTLTVAIQTAAGTPYNQMTAVTFTSPCVEQ